MSINIIVIVVDAIEVEFPVMRRGLLSLQNRLTVLVFFCDFLRKSLILMTETYNQVLDGIFQKRKNFPFIRVLSILNHVKSLRLKYSFKNKILLNNQNLKFVKLWRHHNVIGCFYVPCCERLSLSSTLDILRLSWNYAL